ncbi:MAG: fluoride efflux transporter CrcB [Lentisphaerae bacterium]|jgi:fluoride exporter|nr:fluoride efflux transporter CrcB [Lentisphaerota bacterium]MBT4817090.1 fluoride efflux transporter CrcB [Lentisphaerota bacterium]MBT5608535.1 fluoride efflux transporter CrcB [Lentisphaerota bacterium]MBT7060248.1 fluoride efflux transporter CrcB [Lentisphaerota bacterium]MBT7843252.1 fluoride efflux transporter CrcB [Lentisphaerota bacterium]
MKQVLLVGAGGCVGAILRYKLGGLVLHQFPNSRFPYGTFAVNVAGCLLIGVVAGWIEHHHGVGADLRLLVITGLLGGFTTFSAFGLETVYLLRRGLPMLALANAFGSVALGVLAVGIGLSVGTLLAK